jgi:hypothetical protein
MKTRKCQLTNDVELIANIILYDVVHQTSPRKQDSDDQDLQGQRCSLSGVK